MFHHRQSVYTLVLWISVSLFAVGCGGTGSSSNDSSSDSAASQADPEVPTVTMPDEDAGVSGSSTTDEGSAE